MNQIDLDILKKTILNTLSYKEDICLEVYPHDCLHVLYKNSVLKVGYQNKTQICRAISLSIEKIKDGRMEFSFDEHPSFDLCGAMVDMSRGGVMHIEAVKKFINYMSAMGLNMLMLYTEDTYEVKKYPHFGYLRGKYSVLELVEIDRYAHSMGIEVIPCIQTLGHMEQFLQWREATDMKDTSDILLAGEEKTYELIEECVKTMRLAFQSKRIHIGADEAHDVGLGRYLQLHGYDNRLDLLKRHLVRVCDICRKYDFLPMMWSDMWFRLISTTGQYSDKEIADIILPDSFTQTIPDISMVFWSYSHNSQQHYQSFLAAHKLMKRELVFAGGAWTWIGFLPHTKLAFDSGIAALKECINQGVQHVFVTLWGDQGCETNYFLALPSLALYAQYCYKGLGCKLEDVGNLLKSCTGLSLDALMTMSDFHEEKNRIQCLGKRYLNSDVLLNITGMEDKSISEIFARASKKLDFYSDIDSKWHSYYIYAKLIFDVAAEKASILANLREKYLEKDMEYLKDMCLCRLPRLKALYYTLLAEHQKQWKSTYKAIGWEVINARYGAQILRIDYAIEVLGLFIDRRIDHIEELDEPTIPNSIKNVWGFKGITMNYNSNF